MKIRNTFLAGMLGVTLTGVSIATEPQPGAAPAQPVVRTTVLISDLHFGVGRDSRGNYDPTEDARWPDALRGFLDAIPSKYPGAVDLVILGDMLELWQPSMDIPCKGTTTDLGCTADEADRLVARVLGQHQAEVSALKAFAAKGHNRIYLVPGNHDASMLLPKIRDRVLTAFGGLSDHLIFVDSGIWTSEDGRTRGEHGHQIGADVNRFDRWPIVSKTVGGMEWLERPWGERFVQKLFNDSEREFPIIDNLGPETVGAHYRMAHGGWTGSAKDIARFIAFNLFETSLDQKASLLKADGCDSSSGKQCEVKPDPKWVRENLKGQLIINAMGYSDPLIRPATENSDDGRALRAELDAAVKAADDDVILQYCLLAQANGKPCVDSSLRYTAEKLAQRVTGKEPVLRKYLIDQKVHRSKVANFVYAHTHELETPWSLQVTDGRSVLVANTGAFQRVASGKWFANYLGKKKIASGDALAKARLEDFPECYSYVLVPPVGQGTMQVLAWYQPEGRKGEVVKPDDKHCGYVVPSSH